MPGSILVVTGPKESGKSTFCRELARAAARAGVDVAGVVTSKTGPRASLAGDWEGALPWGGPAGERLVVTDLRTGRQTLLGVWTGHRWTMLEAGFALGRAALADAVPCELLIIDEIGRLELLHGQGWTEALGLLAQGGFCQAVVTVREGCVEAFSRALAAAAPPGGQPPVPAVHTLTAPQAWQALLPRILDRLTHAPTGVVGL